MFQVRKAQMDAIAIKRFVGTAETIILNEWFQRATSLVDQDRVNLRPMVAHAFAVAGEYGLRSERELLSFALNMLTINPGFHNEPSLHAILSDASLSPKERQEHLLRLDDDAWDRAAVMVDARAYWNQVLEGS
jgi:hypothetical protein